MNVPIRKNDVEFALERSYLASLPALPGDEALKARRDSAFREFQRLGLPGRRNEAWHYTDLRNLLPQPGLPAYEPLVQFAHAAPDPLNVSGHVLSLRNGAFLPGQPTPAGVHLFTLQEALKRRPDLVARIGEVVGEGASSVAALNLAMFADALIVLVEKGVQVDVPIHANFHFSGSLAMLMVARGLIIVEEGARATFSHSITAEGNGACQANSVLEVVIGKGARVDYVRYNGCGDNAANIFISGFRLEDNAELNVFNLSKGSRLTRTEAHVTFAGENAKAGIRGVGLLNGEQHSDVTLVVDHQAPNCESRELFRHVVDGQATGIFQGKIMVRQKAQKTDGQMASNAILLSDDATMNNKPELEIFADDVVCAHGATCGALDEDLLFYLQARGLPRREAEALMLQAFCGEAIGFVENESLRDALNGIVDGWLAARAEIAS